MTFLKKIQAKFWLWTTTQPNYLPFQKPKLYFSFKALLIFAIILQRIIIFLENDDDDKISANLVQIMGFLVLLGIEIGLFLLFKKRNRLMQFASIIFTLLQIVIAEYTIAVSRKYMVGMDKSAIDTILRQEVLFIGVYAMLFYESPFLKFILICYIAPTLFYRLSMPINELCFISWGIMLTGFLIACLVVFLHEDEKKVGKTAGDFSSFENIPHGMAILTKDKEVLFMNGVFKGILDLDDEKNALQKVMKLKRFDTYPDQTKQRFLQEIRLRNVGGESRNEVKTPNKQMTVDTKMPSSMLGSNEAIYKKKTTQTKRSILIKKTTLAQDSALGSQRILDSNLESLVHSPCGPDTRLDSTCYNNKISKTFTQDAHQVAINIKNLERLTSLKIESQEDTESTVEFSINSIFSGFLDDAPSKAKRKLSLVQVAKGVAKGLALKRPSQYFIKENNYLTLGNSKTHKIQTVHRNSRGELRILEVVLTPIISKQKDALFVYLYDITSEIRAKEYEETSQYKDKLLKFVSHEFRTPLNVSIISLNMLKPLLPTDIYTNYLAPALNSTVMLLNLVNDILDYSQVQARRLKISIFPSDLKLIIKDVISMMEIQASARNIELKFDWDKKVPRLYYTDGNRLKQVLLNLISNALKFTTQGSITIKTLYVSPTICRVEVIDTGVGISKEGLENLFREFGKVGENEHMNPQGVGLGLVISKLLTHELGPGNVGLQVKSEVGVGTTFSFLLMSKTDTPDKVHFENTELESSDEEQAGPENVMPKMNVFRESIQSGKKKSLFLEVESPLANSRRSSDIMRKSKTQAFDKVPQTIPFTFNFAHSYSKGTFSNITRLISTIAPYPEEKGVYNYKNRRAQTKGNIKLQRCLSTGTRTDLDDDVYSEKVADTFRKLNQVCKCSKVLIVDDNAFNLSALKMMFKGFDIPATCAIDGELAIHEVMDNEDHHKKCRNFAIIFMDVEMPRMDGFETSKTLRKMMLNKEITYIPIVGITGHNPQEKRVECLLSGMNDMVSKPVSPQTIQELLSKWVCIQK